MSLVWCQHHVLYPPPRASTITLAGWGVTAEEAMRIGDDWNTRIVIVLPRLCHYYGLFPPSTSASIEK